MAQSLQVSALHRYRQGSRSCRGCYQRKVRCDRELPCSNCSRYDIPCVYPRTTEVARKEVSLQTISSRLEKLEDLLTRFVGDNDDDLKSVPVRTDIRNGSRMRDTGRFNTENSKIDPLNHVPTLRNSQKLTWDLLLDDEKASHGRTAEPHSAPHTQQNCHFADTVSDVLQFYPNVQLALHLWHVYVQSVDPVLQILHIPSTQSVVIKTILDPRSAQPSTLALMFSIYFAAITAMIHNRKDEHELIGSMGEKSILLNNYKTALHQLLVGKELFQRPDVKTLQAMAIYATCLRAHEVGRNVWVRNGLAVRLAQSIDMRRDGSQLGLSHFETEMRLRIWWHLCVLESRAPEDQGFLPTIDITNKGLRLPRNVNDDQIYPDMTQLPADSDEWTEMSFSLIQIDACRLLHPVLDTSEQYPIDTLGEIAQKREIIERRRQNLLTRLQKEGAQLSNLAIQHGVTACRKMEFVLQLREEITKQDKRVSDSTSDVHRLSFKLACESLESSLILVRGDLLSGFEWFFKIYTPWYALVYVLRCLCNSPHGTEADRAWSLVGDLFPYAELLHVSQEGAHDEFGHSSIWRHLSVLRDKATSLRRRDELVVERRLDNELCHVGDYHCSTDDEVSLSVITPARADVLFPHSPLTQRPVDDFDPDLPSPLLFPMHETSFIPDWNAVINGCLNDHACGVKTSSFND